MYKNVEVEIHSLEWIPHFKEMIGLPLFVVEIRIPLCLVSHWFFLEAQPSVTATALSERNLIGATAR